MFKIIILIFLINCAGGYQPKNIDVINNYQSQDIDLNNVKIRLYASFDDLQKEYKLLSGEDDKVLGFYNVQENKIHCIKWDFTICGHELYHALFYKGNPKLKVHKKFHHYSQ